MEAIEKTLKTSLAKEKIKKMRIAGRGKESGDKKPSRIKLLVGVVSAGDAAEVSRLCNSVGAALSYSFEAFGTAQTAVLDYLGLGETPKRVILSLIPESAEKSILEGIQKEMALYLVGKGICFTLPLTGVSSIVANGLLKGAPQEKNNGREGKMKEDT